MAIYLHMDHMDPCEKPPQESHNLLAAFERLFQEEVLIAICRFCVIFIEMQLVAFFPAS